MIVIWILTALTAVLLILGGAAIFLSMRRRPYHDPRDADTVAHTAWHAYTEPVLEGVNWIAAQPQEAVSIQSDDGLTLRARYLPLQQGGRGIVLLFHGFHSSPDIDFSKIAPMYHSLGLELLLVDQRAHGESQGRYLTYGVRERMDCLRWAEYCAQRFGDTPLFLSGMSMGAATVLMAADLLLPPTVRGIVADCGYASPWDALAHVIRVHTRFPASLLLGAASPAFRLLTGGGLRTHTALKSVAASHLPVLLFHGTADQLVPFSMAPQIRDACSGPAELIAMEGATHGVCSFTEPERYRQALSDFLDRCL